MLKYLYRTKENFITLLQELWSSGRGWILLAVSAGWALSMGVRFVYPALAPFIQSEFQIGLTTTGLLLTMLWGAYATGHVPGGILGDRIGEGNILVLSTIISAGAIFIVSTSINVFILFIGTISYGFATALYGPTRFTIFTDIYPKRAGSAIGLTMAGGNLGNTIFPIAATFIATFLTWRLGFAVFVPFFIAVAIVLWLVVPSYTSARSSMVDNLSLNTIRRIGKRINHGSIPVIFLIQISMSFINQGFVSFYPTYLIAIKGLATETAATLFGLFFAFGILIQPTSGIIMDRVGMQRTLIVFLSGCVLGLWLLPFSHGILPLIAVTILFSSWNGCGVITQTYIADSLPEDVQGTGLGTLKAGWMMIGAASPLIIGILADAGHFNIAFLLLAVVGSIGVIISLLYL